MREVVSSAYRLLSVLGAVGLVGDEVDFAEEFGFVVREFADHDGVQCSGCEGLWGVREGGRGEGGRLAERERERMEVLLRGQVVIYADAASKGVCLSCAHWVADLVRLRMRY